MTIKEKAESFTMRWTRMAETEEPKLEITGATLDERIRHIASLNGVSVNTLRKAFDGFLKCFEKKDNTETDLSKPKDYLIISYGDGIEIVKGAKSFKDAIMEIEHNDLLKKALTAFDDNDVNDIIELAKKFSYTIYGIEQVYIVERKIYDQYSVQCVQISDGRY